MGEGNSPSNNNKCPYLTSEEDYWQTTIYPKCTCNCSHCNEYSGYCPVRD